MSKLSVFLFILFVSVVQVKAQEPQPQTPTKTPYIQNEIRSQLSLELYGSAGFTNYNTGLYVINTNVSTGGSSTEEVTISFGSGAGIGIRYGTMISKKMQFSLGAYYQYSSFSRTLTNASGGIPRFNFNPNLRYFINTKNMRSRFYGGLGLLISAGTVYKLKATDPNVGSVDLNFKYKTAVGPTVEIGFEKFLRPFLSLDFTVKYHYLTYSLTEATNSGQAVTTDQIRAADLSGFIKPDGQGMDFVVAVKYCF